MTKKKKEPAKELNTKSKLLSGKVTKAKNMETIAECPVTKNVQVKAFKTPLAPRARKKSAGEPVLVTPFLSKCTSTPMTAGSVPNKNVRRSGRVEKKNVQCMDLGATSALSPILADIGNLRSKRATNVSRNKNSFEGVCEHDKENVSTSSSPSPSNSERNVLKSLRVVSSSPLNKSEQNALKSLPPTANATKVQVKSIPSPRKVQAPESARSHTRRRSVGTRRVVAVPEAQNQYRENNCSKLRVRVARTSVDSPNLTLEDSAVPKPPRTRKASQMIPESPNDNSLVKRLRGDWSTTAIEETPTQMPPIRRIGGDSIPRKPLRMIKPQLTPLIEISTASAAPSTAAASKRKVSASDYSSSEEFENTPLNERASKRFKKAPTWRNLSNKTNESLSSTPRSVSPPKMRRKSRRRLSKRSKLDSAAVVQIVDSDNPTSDVPSVHTALSNTLVEIDWDADVRSDNAKPGARKKTGGKQSVTRSPLTPRNVKPREESAKENALIRKSARGRQKGEERSTLTPRNVPPREESATENALIHKSARRNQPKNPSPGPARTPSKTAKEQESMNFSVDPSSVRDSPSLNLSQPRVVLKRANVTPLKSSSADVAKGDESKNLSAANGNASVNTSADLTIKSPQGNQSKNSPDGSAKKNSSPAALSDKSADLNQPKTPSFNLRERTARGNASKNSPSDQASRGNQSKNSSVDVTVTEKASSPASRSRNLKDKSDLIEELLSSSNDDELNGNTMSATNLNTANCTKKFFHSRVENTTADPKSVEPVKTRRRTRNQKEQDKIYEFLSQSSSSDKNDPVADVIQKMIKSGKVAVAKLKKGTGKSIVKQQKRKRKPKPPASQLVEPKVVSEQPPAKKKAMNTVHFDEDTHFDDDNGMDFYEEEPSKGGFSELARSAMMKEAGKSQNTPQRRMITDRKKLLAMAQKFVGQSTPVRSPSRTSEDSAARYSPMPGASSPWRVDDDKLPNLFYFSRNSDNLPSFSSDYIPSTPTKNKSKSASSFSSNDSNMENIAPPSVREPDNENPPSSVRRGLTSRSPLKAINILDVVHLPSLALSNIAKDTTKEAESSRTNKSTADASSSCKTNLFGFEDIIDDTEDDLTDVTLDPKAVPNRDHLKEKLERLRRLRPEKPVVASTSKNAPTKSVFDENRPKQRTLQQMLCSTMIERRSKQNDEHESYFNDGYDMDLSNLFKDPEPETTFDVSNPRRTYSRPFQKKRKLRNNFVMFMDSDASDDEDAEAAEKETKQKRSKKRQRKEPKEDNKELTKFVDEFNEMCKEVSQYELLVE